MSSLVWTLRDDDFFCPPAIPMRASSLSHSSTLRKGDFYPSPGTPGRPSLLPHRVKMRENGLPLKLDIPVRTSSIGRVPSPSMNTPEEDLFISQVSTPIPTSPVSRQNTVDDTELFPTLYPDISYASWPTPSEYRAPRLTDSDEVEPFPDYANPCNTLIRERTFLLDHLHFHSTSLQQAAMPPKGFPFDAIISRVVPQTGHIKPNQDLSRCRSPVSSILAMGERTRAQRRLGNAGKLFRLNDQHANDLHKDSQPKDLLKAKLRVKCGAGIAEALRFEADVGWDILNKSREHRGLERGRGMRRGPPATFDRELVVTSLNMLRQSFPRYYEGQNGKPRPSEKNLGKAGSVGQGRTAPEPYRAYSPLAERYREPSPDTGRPSHASESKKSLRSTTSAAESIKAFKKKANLLLRRAAARMGIRRSSSRDHARSPPSVRNDNQGAVSDVVIDTDSLPFPPKMKHAEAENNRLILPARDRSRSGSTSNEDPSRRQGRFFTIECEVVLPPEPSFTTQDSEAAARITSQRSWHTSPIPQPARSRPRSRSPPRQLFQATVTESATLAPISLISRSNSMTCAHRTGEAETVRISKPLSRARIISIKIRNRLSKGGNSHTRQPKATVVEDDYQQLLHPEYIHFGKYDLSSAAIESHRYPRHAMQGYDASAFGWRAAKHHRVGAGRGRLGTVREREF